MGIVCPVLPKSEASHRKCADTLSGWVSPLYASGIAVALLVLAVAQIGIHLVFFLHITTDPDNENNILALAFGVLIVCLIVFGSLWVMLHLNHNLMPMDKLIGMQR